VPERIFVTKRDEMLGGRRNCIMRSSITTCRIHQILYEERMIKSRRMGSAGSVARMGEKREAYRSLVGEP
jgi:hypothetical protein